MKNKLENLIDFNKIQDYDFVSKYIEMALNSNDSNLTNLACDIYFSFENKKKLEKHFNQLLVSPNHYSHQYLAEHLQRIKYSSSVQYIRKLLESEFNYLPYPGNDDAVMAKWFSHALNCIGTKDAIDLMKEYANSNNHQIKDEMRYRLFRGSHIKNIDYPTPNLDLELYTEKERNLPDRGDYLIGQEKDEMITFYAAFNKNIVNSAIKNQKFGAGFNFNRMTWIKPSFMWMMHRSGWATKNNQEFILAIKIHRKNVKKILNDAVLSSFTNSGFRKEEEWKSKLVESDVRIQWDPEHNKDGRKLRRKAIQIGIKGKTLKLFNDEYIESIEHITEFVEAQRVHKKIFISDFLIPKERIIILESKGIKVGKKLSLLHNLRLKIKNRM